MTVLDDLLHASCERERLVFEALGAASTCWDGLNRAGVFDSTRAKQIGEQLLDDLRRLEQPSLGLATTKQLLDELHTRLALDLRDLTPQADAVARVRIELQQQHPSALAYRTVDCDE
jgi:hypothetical protein